EEVAPAHARITLETEGATDWAGFIRHDLRDPARVLVDPAKPTCLLLVAALHFLGPDDAPGELVEQYREELAPGSWLAISHITMDETAPEDMPGALGVAEAYRSSSNPFWTRPKSQIAEFFGGWPMVEPGLVLSAGETRRASGRSSKPTTLTSSGTRSPRSFNAW